MLHCGNWIRSEKIICLFLVININQQANHINFIAKMLYEDMSFLNV